MAVELAELIGQLRAELTTAMAEGGGEDLRFELGDVELELNVKVAKEVKSGAKVRFWVVDAGVDGKVAADSGHVIKLTLTPHLASRPGRRPTISGIEEQGER